MTDYRTFVAERFLKRTESAEGLIHVGVGMIGEVAEYYDAKDRHHRIEELGDIEFYWEAAHIVLGGIEPCPGGEFAPLLQGTSHFLDQAKKVWVYNKPIDRTEFCRGLIQVRSALTFLYDDLEITQESSRQANMKKLLLRYPAGYTDALALERRDKA